MPPEIMEEMRDEVLANGSDPENRAGVAHRFFPGDDRALNETHDEEYVNVFRGNLHIRVGRRYVDWNRRMRKTARTVA